MGDLNAKIGSERCGEVVGAFGLGDRNERGEKWVEWCESWEQIIMNTTSTTVGSWICFDLRDTISEPLIDCYESIWFRQRSPGA